MAVTPRSDFKLAPRDHGWDAAAAERRLRQAAGATDAPNARYARCFFWMASGDDADGDKVPDRFGDYKLPFCDVVGGEIVAVPQAIIAAAGAVSGARGGVDIPGADRQAVKDHIAHYYDKMKMTPPWVQGHAMARFEVAHCAASLPPGGAAPDWIELMPVGQVTPQDGRQPWANDDPAAVIAASVASGRDLPIDYEHQTQMSAKNGQPAPASGWIKELAVRDEAIWARVDWTDRARQMIAAGEYRYVSPSFIHTKGRKVVRITGAALVNDPALHMTALAKRESEMDERLKAALDALGLGDDADDKAIAKAVADLKAGTAVKAIAKAAGLADDASAADVETAVAKAVATASGKSGDPDPEKFVSIAKFDDLQKELATLKGDRATEKAETAVAKAIENGKIAPAQKDWAVSYAKRDPDGFAEFTKAQPVIIKPGAQAKPKPGSKPADAPLDDVELATCRATGMSSEDFKKERARLAALEEEAA